LEFFQDLLEARINGDPEYAFRKFSLSIDRVLTAEGMAAEEDARGKPAMFAIDYVPNADKSEVVVTRPALTQGSICVLRGYARRFTAEIPT
jgi:hypothetical protein